MTGPSAHSASVVARLLRLGWKYRLGSLQILSLQVLVLSLGIAGLGLTGLGIDVIRAFADPAAPPPAWPFGFAPPPSWKPLPVLLLIAGGVLLCATLRALATYAFTVSSSRLIEFKVVATLRAEVYDRLQRLSFRFLDAHASGTLINRVTGDSRAVANFLNGVLIQGIIMGLSLALYLIYMVRIHPGLTLACLGSTPLLWFFSTWFSRSVQPDYQRNRELVDSLILSLAETVQGMHVVKGFGTESIETAKFASINRSIQDQQKRVFAKVSLFTPGISFVTQINLTILLLYGGWLVIHQELPLGAGLVVFAGLLQQFSGQVANLSTLANTAQQSLTGARRVFEVLDMPIEVQSPPEPVTLPAVRGALRFEQTTFAYQPGGPAVLRAIDLEIAPGSFVGILGPVGAGKSTLLSLISRFYDPSTGRVLLDGHDLRTLDLDFLRRQVGIVFQESFLFSNTVAANIAFGHPQATREQIERAARVAAAHDFITALPAGYDTVLHEGGGNLSGGQRQRLALARAILLDPPLLLLDDPTASIDPRTEGEIFLALDQVTRGRTTLLIANRLSALRRAQRILVMEDGRIVQDGTHAQLLAAEGPYRRAARLQFSPGLPAAPASLP